jgi:cytochrome-b5 reductase
VSYLKHLHLVVSAAPAAGMIAGGTGVTPMYQVAAAILKDPQDSTRISLLFGNLTADDILIKQELDALAAAHPKRFSVYYVLNTPPANWAGGQQQRVHIVL